MSLQNKRSPKDKTIYIGAIWKSSMVRPKGFLGHDWTFFAVKMRSFGGKKIAKELREDTEWIFSRVHATL